MELPRVAKDLAALVRRASSSVGYRRRVLFICLTSTPCGVVTLSAEISCRLPAIPW